MFREMDRWRGGTIVSASAYNLVIGGITLYGLIMNAVICYCFQDYFLNLDFLKVFIGYVVSCFVGIFIVNKANSPVVAFIGYNLIVLPVGMLVSIIVASFSTTVVFKAVLATALVTMLMIIISSIYPEIFYGLGKTLFLGLLLSIVVEFMMIFFGIETGLLDWIVAMIFCGYIGYDWARANRKEMTMINAVSSAAEIYLDIINLFIRILNILGKKK